MTRKHKCDCHFHTHQVCDVCQGTKGKKLRDKRVTHGGLRILRKTSDAYEEHASRSIHEHFVTPHMSFNELAEANEKARQQAREGWKDLGVEKTVSSKGVVRRKNINYGRDATSKLLPKLTGQSGPLYSLNRLLGLSEINQGLLKINAGDLPSSGIKVKVHLPQVNQVIEAVIQPEFRFAKGIRSSPFLRQAISGKKRMSLIELGSDSDTPQIQITFY